MTNIKEIMGYGRVMSMRIGLLGLLLFVQCTPGPPERLPLNRDDHIVLIGNNLASRMMNFGHFETELHLRFPDSLLIIRNMADGGNTPGFRPHPGRESPWAFAGADSFHTRLATPSGSHGHFKSPDQWLTRLKADVVIAFFGFSAAFGDAPRFEEELETFVRHTLAQAYNGHDAPHLALVSPIAFENISDRMDVPDGTVENVRLAEVTEIMRQVAERTGVFFVDVFGPSKRWYRRADTPLTIDGSQLNDEGYARLSRFLANQLFGVTHTDAPRELVHEAVMEKNWLWHNDFKIPNGVHAYGRRFEPFGPDNYPAEFEKIRQMTALRDTAIWRAAQGQETDLPSMDRSTRELPEVITNYELGPDNGEIRYLYGEEAVAQLTTAPGYKVELFASEREFEELANPVQMSFDNRGRLWVAVTPSYPHYRPGDARPNDKLIILEDTDQDGRADTLTTWADGLHLPMGFEFAPEGVYVSQGTNLVLLSDTDGDDRADTRQIVLSGFDDHDTHHVISAFVADPSGAIYMGEGVFLHSNVETSYGPVRGTNGGFFRYAPQRRHLERTAQLSIPNPWGIAFDEWGQVFFAETSGPDVRWMMPGTIKPRYGDATHKSHNIIEDAHRVRPTAGLEFVSSRHFPDEVQGDLLINNTIGFLGTKQHAVHDDGTGYGSTHRHDLISGTDGNFRPVDMEFAPDGSLYFLDWHNVLIGHMQHNARDPLRDHVHGRVYRITYPSRPLVTPPEVAGAPIEILLDNLKLPEYRARYRTRRELRGRNADTVLDALALWTARLDTADSRYEHHLLEALWVTWGLNHVDQDLLRRLLHAEDYRARAAAVRVLRYSGHQVPDQAALLAEAAADAHGRVRLEAIVAASWLEPEQGMPALVEAGKLPLDRWMINAHVTALAHLRGESITWAPAAADDTDLTGAALERYKAGKALYNEDDYCGTCHRADGQGLPAADFPPLAGSEWVTGDLDRLIKVTLHGLIGPIEVRGVSYSGRVPMMPFKDLLSDEEVAAILTYVRNAFGNSSSTVEPDAVARVRASTADRTGFYTGAELISLYHQQLTQCCSIIASGRRICADTHTHLTHSPIRSQLTESGPKHNHDKSAPMIIMEARACPLFADHPTGR